MKPIDPPYHGGFSELPRLFPVGVMVDRGPAPLDPSVNGIAPLILQDPRADGMVKLYEPLFCKTYSPLPRWKIASSTFASLAIPSSRSV